MKCPSCKAGVQERESLLLTELAHPHPPLPNLFAKVFMNSTHLRCTTIYPSLMKKKKKTQKAILLVVNSKTQFKAIRQHSLLKYYYKIS